MVAAAVFVSLALAAQAEPPPSPSPSPSASPSPSPSPSPWPSAFPVPSPSPRPVADSIDRVVARIESEKNDPCFEAKRDGVPCFPVRTDMNGPTASVREGLGLPGPRESEKPSPDRPPTVAEMGPYRANVIAPSLVDVTIDPGCVGKSLLKGLRGKNDTYYLYRLRDTAGERVVLYDHRIDATKFQGEVAFLGEFQGECAAISAYERERRRIGTP